MPSVELFNSPPEFESRKNLFEARGPARKGIARLRVVSYHELLKRNHLVSVPGSKSFTNRAICIAGLAKRRIKLRGVLFSDDSYWGFDCLLRLGFKLAIDFDAHLVEIDPPKSFLESTTQPVPLYFGMAGTLARFFPAVLLNGPFASIFKLSGEKRLCERPLAELTVALRELGAQIEGDGLPLEVRQSELKGSCSISGEKSGQFLSGLLIAAASARHPIEIKRVDHLVQPNYVRMTIDALHAFGAKIKSDADLTHFSIEPVAELFPENLSASNDGVSGQFVVEADASTACYFISMAVLLNLDLKIVNIGLSTRQPDMGFVLFLERLGAEFELSQNSVRHCPRKSSNLSGGFEVDFNAMSDQALTAGLMALFCDAPITVTGVAHIRKHESDRIASFCENLKSVNATATEHKDGFTVYPVQDCLRGIWETHHDHRFSMIGALLAMKEPLIWVAEPSCCEKTAPSFFADLERMGVVFETEQS